MFLGKKFRDYLGIVMALFFGFSTVISLVFNKNYLYKIGTRKILQKDVLNFGGSGDEKSFRRAISILYQNALIGCECDKLGIFATDSDVRDMLKSFMSFNGIVDEESFKKMTGGYNKEYLIQVFRNSIERSHLFYIPNKFAKVNTAFTKEFLKKKFRKVSGYYKAISLSDLPEKEAESIVNGLKNKFFLSASLLGKPKFFSNNGFIEFENLSIDSCFKEKGCKECGESRCAKCLANGCLCSTCFDEENRFGLDRRLALILLHSEIQKFVSFQDKERIVMVFIDKTEEVEPSEDNINKVSFIYDELLKSMIQIAYIGDLSVQNRIS